MTPKEAAQYLGSLGGRANTGRKTPAHADKLRVILAAARATRAKRLADAARIAAVSDTERRGASGTRGPQARQAGSTPAPAAPFIHTDGRPAARAGALLNAATRQEPAPSTIQGERP
jgi:hypothetical protein